MKTIIFPVILFIIGLAVANIFFGVDVEGLAEGFLDFVVNLFKGPDNQ